MNKPKPHNNLIPVRDFAAQYITRRGFQVSVQYIYKLIADHKAGRRDSLPFEYVEKGKGIWIRK